MDTDERDIVTFLQSWSGQYVSAKEIARRAAGKKRFQQEPYWAVPVLGRLVEKGLLESNSTAHYRLLTEEKKREPRKWISPEIKKLLEQTGEEFRKGAEIGEPENPDVKKGDA